MLRLGRIHMMVIFAHFCGLLLVPKWECADMVFTEGPP